MNLKDLIQTLCYELNIPAPTSFVGATDPAALQLLTLYNSVARDLLARKPWPYLKKTHSFTTSNGVNSYALPTDFYASLFDTQWDTTNKIQLNGPMSDSEFNRRLYGYASVDNQLAFRVFGHPSLNQFVVDPTPGTTTLTLKFDYISKSWVINAGGGILSAIEADTDSAVFSDDIMIKGLKYKWLQAKGLEFEVYREEYEAAVDMEISRYFGAKKIDMGGLSMWPQPNIPEGNWS